MSTHFRPQGYSAITPILAVHDAADAITFYEKVFGATVVARMDGPDGSVWHAELDLGAGRLQVMDANEQFHMVTLDRRTDDVPYGLSLYVEDVDAVVAAATAEGATVREEPGDFEVTGDRFASVRDPFGVRWTLLTRVHERTDEQVQQGLDAWAASMQE